MITTDQEESRLGQVKMGWCAEPKIGPRHPRSDRLERGEKKRIAPTAGPNETKGAGRVAPAVLSVNSTVRYLSK
jgi:hypothetical protein